MRTSEQTALEGISGKSRAESDQDHRPSCNGQTYENETEPGIEHISDKARRAGTGGATDVLSRSTPERPAMATWVRAGAGRSEDPQGRGEI